MATLRGLSAPAPAIAPAFSTRGRPPVRSRIAVALADADDARIDPVVRIVGDEGPASPRTALGSSPGAPPPSAGAAGGIPLHPPPEVWRPFTTGPGAGVPPPVAPITTARVAAPICIV